jgi:lysophospholipase L1-like esterase
MLLQKYSLCWLLSGDGWRWKRIALTYSDDGVHPNKAGYQVMEPLVENTIQIALDTQ